VLAATGPSTNRCSDAPCRTTAEPEGAPRSRSRRTPTTTGTHAHGGRPVRNAGHCSPPLVQPPSRGASHTPASPSWVLPPKLTTAQNWCHAGLQHSSRVASHDSDRTHSGDASTTSLASPELRPRAYTGRRQCCAGAEPQVRHPTCVTFIIDPPLSASTVERRTPPSARVWRAQRRSLGGHNPLWEGGAGSDDTMSGKIGVMGWFVCDVVRRRWRGAACSPPPSGADHIGAGAHEVVGDGRQAQGRGWERGWWCTAPAVGHRPHLAALRSLAWGAG
jgi:hypothetical protein